MRDLFFPTQADRVALARQRYFEEGMLPTGVVSDGVFQSWARCQRKKLDPRSRVEFQPVSESRAQLALQKNRLLRKAWLDEVAELEMVLKDTHCSAMLTDASGVLIGATHFERPNEVITPIAHRAGVNFSESLIGTTAPGIVIHTGQPACVRGAEHYYEGVRAMHCAAAPIRGIDGQVAGVLDVSSESSPFDFDATALVSVFASTIENRLLVTQSEEHLVLRFQVVSSLLDTPVAGLIGVDMEGGIAWKNSAACKLLGLESQRNEAGRLMLEEVLHSSFAELASLPASRSVLVRLQNGLMIHARSEMRVRDGLRNLVAVSETSRNALLREEAVGLVCPPAVNSDPGVAEIVGTPVTRPASLRDADAGLIAKTLEECGGNVSAAARKLRVSRGLIYRRTQASPCLVKSDVSGNGACRETFVA